MIRPIELGHKRVADIIAIDIPLEAVMGHQRVQRSFIKGELLDLTGIARFVEPFANCLTTLKVAKIAGGQLMAISAPAVVRASRKSSNFTLVTITRPLA